MSKLDAIKQVLGMVRRAPERVVLRAIRRVLDGDDSYVVIIDIQRYEDEAKRRGEMADDDSGVESKDPFLIV